VSPDSAAGYASNVPQSEKANPPTAVNTAGTESEYGGGIEGGLKCSGNMLVGSYWVSATLVNISSVDTATYGARMNQILGTVATALANAKPAAAWNPPAPTLPSICTSPTTIGTVETARGANGLVAFSPVTSPFDAGYLADLNSNDPSAVIEVLRGGAWAVPLLSWRP
jgi:hypothetical protein